MLMRDESIKKFIQCAIECLDELTIEVDQLDIKFQKTAICLANPNFATMFQYEDKNDIIMKTFIDAQKQSLEERFLHAEQYWAKSSTETPGFALHDDILTDDTLMTTTLQKLSYSTYFTFHTLSFVLEQRRNVYAIPHIHISLAFIWSLMLISESMVRESLQESRLRSPDFLISTSPALKQLPEDFFIQDQIWTQFTYPKDFFKGTEIDETKRRLKWPSLGRWIEPFNHEDMPKFRPTAYTEKLESSAKHSVMFKGPP
ncbi:hypothetical protein AJ78_08675 [Emergomyces pasteurianus Ep9510]|uniref:Uncharacterized protein n=1 Tax=Emergomyces pasteurianus Ep9510 TaxID=1447872 RepID=A0A1J9P304_9EURO|nr:hypothetical protein AJ78_08675 [Emergomyces pasteurianus Ep9510]